MNFYTPQFPHVYFEGPFIAAWRLPRLHLPHKDSASATSDPSGSVPSEQHGPTRYVSENVPAEGNLAAQDLEPKNGTKTGRFNKGGGEVLFRRKWSWGCGRVFEKKTCFCL